MAAPAATAASNTDSRKMVHIRLPSGSKATSVRSNSATRQMPGNCGRGSLDAKPSRYDDVSEVDGGAAGRGLRRGGVHRIEAERAEMRLAGFPSREELAAR